MLTARTDLEEYVEAADAVRGKAYQCRECREPVTFKAGTMRIAHFAHHPGSTCSFGAAMSLAHLEAQRRIALAVRPRGVVAELEAFMPSLAGDRRVDVLVWSKGRPDARIAVEVQASDMTPELIEARTRSYDAEGIAPLWLRLIDFGRFDSVSMLQGRRTIWVPKYRARAWERWAYEHLGERLWFLDQSTFLAWRGTFVPAHSYKQSSSWYDSYGDEQSAGGYWCDITQWVELELEGPFDLAALRINRGRRVGADGVRRWAAWFVPPDEEGQPAPSASFVRSQFKRTDHWIEIRVLEVQVNGQWAPAVFSEPPGDWRTAGAGATLPAEASMNEPAA